MTRRGRGQAVWHIQDGGQLFSKTVPFLPAIAHKSETSTATGTKLGLPEPIFGGSVLLLLFLPHCDL